MELAENNNLQASYLADCNNLLAEAYLDKMRDSDKALIHYQAALQHANISKASNKIAQAQNGIGRSMILLGQKEEGLSYVQRAYDTYVENKNEIRIKEGAAFLADFFEKEGNYKAAYQYLKVDKSLSDSIYSEKSAKAFAENEVRFGSLEKDKSIAQQKLEIEKARSTRNQTIFIALGILALASFLFQRFYYRQRRKKQAVESDLLLEKQEAEKLRELDRLKSSFFTNISHELRTPLTLVSAPLSDALKEIKASPLKKTLELAHSNAQNLSRLVNEILDLSKLEAGKVETKLSEVELMPLLRRLFFAFESLAEVRGLDLVFNSNIPKDLKVKVDVEKFEKIINNLLSNAVKFTQKGGKITMNIDRKEGQFQFEVIDTGMGISETELSKIFDRFYQSTAPNTPLQGGTGIGLSLAKELAQLMKGDLIAQSEEGKGSRFLLNLPLDYSGAMQKQIENPAVESTNTATVQAIFPPYQSLLLNGKKPRLLIVEDNLEMSAYLYESLSKDYDCVKAYDGLEGLTQIDQQDFDLIISDVMMPNLDGFALREKLLEQEKYLQIPYVMLTARAMEEDKLRGLRLGVDDYLTKPFSMDELKVRLHNLLANKMARDQFLKESEATEEKTLSHEEVFLRKAEAFVLKNIDVPELRVEEIARELNLSHRQFSRLLNKRTGMSPVKFVLEIRLQKARQLLENRSFATVSEVRYEVGIESASYFTKKFTERFGRNPKDY